MGLGAGGCIDVGVGGGGVNERSRSKAGYVLYPRYFRLDQQSWTVK